MRHSIKMIVLLLTVIFFLQTVQAHENLTIVKVDHTLIKERQSGEWTIRTFLINITLANSGDTISDGTTISIEEILEKEKSNVVIQSVKRGFQVFQLFQQRLSLKRL
ncbi:MAG TPA: hypothetical protein EYP23_02840 [Thermoplasmata archaeon]|nr:hypothetical protein [Thermoplasmata archaeon]